MPFVLCPSLSQLTSQDTRAVRASLLIHEWVDMTYVQIILGTAPPSGTTVRKGTVKLYDARPSVASQGAMR
eukprot:CAMPEP_0179696536 /NCGR_PEP_ID=MMETSP0936-20121108/6918_1 /TAXON_ID=548131 ORGANISM="Ostreococcus mediterraneus, Strain clade-D-RCC2573" /NCGR_SAMPLE_ID=MMETSP0936 /ASSEMBLY_ACC=CAM_ASM_000574 /LENGTH=70 /DNA_ID=CAMNT_0021569489 /DNA_START=26 /DNA_END=235 /DNA_ORIENTATION=+